MQYHARHRAAQPGPSRMVSLLVLSAILLILSMTVSECWTDDWSRQHFTPTAGQRADPTTGAPPPPAAAKLVVLPEPEYEVEPAGFLINDPGTWLINGA